jgi:hypothetical protein
MAPRQPGRRHSEVVAAWEQFALKSLTPLVRVEGHKPGDDPESCRNLAFGILLDEQVDTAAVSTPVFSSRSLAKKTPRGYLSSFRETGFYERIASSMVEQETLNLLVVGSSPTRCTIASRFLLARIP